LIFFRFNDDDDDDNNKKQKLINTMEAEPKVSKPFVKIPVMGSILSYFHPLSQLTFLRCSLMLSYSFPFCFSK
jgi:hypothetical protein